MVEVPASVVEQIQADLGDWLRVVISFDSAGYTVESIRDDVEAERPAHELDTFYHTLRFERMKQPMYERLLAGGDLESVVHRFSELVVFAYYTGVDEGLVVSVDAGANVREGLLYDHVRSWLNSS